ncbi:MAG TPA: DNA polymerase/3'-5' exonuclease PolX [Vicinamibacterales bacterium]|nr:DNA polymerase/3'-5' exonuclease PolX [Vicinamibacterales bacterium]
MDNRAVAQVLGEIADLLEIKGENAFKIRAYRSAADTVAAWGDAVSRMDETQLRDLPGIGKDLTKKIQELTSTGVLAYHQELLQEFPPTILDLLRLQGVGPKTVALLYASLGIRSVDDLAAAARDGRLRDLKGMGPKKEALILKAIDEREKDAGRHLLADTTAVAAELISYLRNAVPAVDFVPVGSLRRGCETCGDIDILAVGGDPSIMSVFVAYPGVERILGQGDTKCSLRIQGGYQADLRLVPGDSRGAAMQYFTGAKAHNIVLRDRAIQRGLKLNEYGLFRVDGDERIAGESEEGIYEALGLPWIDPELRENRGEIEAAAARTLPRLVSASDLLGDLHMHTTESDGRDDLETMAAAAHRAGHRYIAITDHSKALAMANGLDETRALAHAAGIRALNGRFDGLTLLAGIECDILVDGRMDLADDCLAQLDFVVASVHSHFSQDEAQMTDRVLRAMECPWVDVIGHPTGRLLLKRDPVRIDMDAVMNAAAAKNVALEINSTVDRLDLNDSMARTARDRGVKLIISTDAHSTVRLGHLRWGVQVARRAWLRPDDVLNTRPLAQFLSRLRRHAGSSRRGSDSAP